MNTQTAEHHEALAEHYETLRDTAREGTPKHRINARIAAAHRDAAAKARG